MRAGQIIRFGWIMVWAMANSGQIFADEAGLPASDEPKMLDPVVVTASRLASPLSQVGSSVTVISKKDLEQQGVKNVGEALALVPGMDVVESGGPGQLSEIYIRGAESGRTLVMINGAEINDAMSAGRSVDFSHLTVDNVERIEVLRGPQSAVYGSGAMGGVVNIITKKGTKQWTGDLDVSGGKYTTWNAAAAAAGSVQDLDLSLGASWGYTKGFSAAKQQAYPEPVPDMEPNGDRFWNLDLGLGYALSRDWSTRGSYRFNRGDTQLDNYSWDVRDTVNYFAVSNQQSAHWELSGRPNSWWQQTLSAGLAQEDREYHYHLESTPVVDTTSEYHGRNVNLDWRHQLDWLDWNSTVAGVNYRQEQGRFCDLQYLAYFDEQSAHQTGVHVEDRITQWGAVLDSSARWDVYDCYGTRFTYRLAPVYTWARTGSSVRGSWGTGFNAPSLYQLYSSYGNVDLQPETSVGWDVGVEQKFGSEYKAGVTYFQTDFSNQINYDFITSRYANLGKVQTKGWEVFGVAVPRQDLTLRLGYTKLTANDLTNQDTLGPVPLERRADYKITFDAGYQWHGFSVNTSVQYVGPRWERDNDYQRIVVVPYTLVDLRLSYAVTEALEVYTKINNLLDADYTEVYGYNTSRFAALSGLKYRWK